MPKHATFALGNVTARLQTTDTKVGTVTINLGTSGPIPPSSGLSFCRVSEPTFRVWSADKIVAAINSSTAPTGFVPIDQDRTESVGGTVSTVKDGLDVVLGAASRLLCNIASRTQTGEDDATPIGGVPSITVSEGFATAWETELNTDIGQTMITLKMNNLPEGVNLRWPHVVSSWRIPRKARTPMEYAHADTGIPSNSRPF